MEGTRNEKALVWSVGIVTLVVVDYIMTCATDHYLYIGPLVFVAQIIVSGFMMGLAMAITIDETQRYKRRMRRNRRRRRR